MVKFGYVVVLCVLVFVWWVLFKILKVFLIIYRLIRVLIMKFGYGLVSYYINRLVRIILILVIILVCVNSYVVCRCILLDFSGVSMCSIVILIVSDSRVVLII